MPELPPVDALMLLGPTGSGKSALALELAQQFPIEIISVDSAQVYRGLDIGTAKPDPRRARRRRHHLIDLRDPAERYSAADFVRDAEIAVAEVRSRGRLPLLVGGTMLYAKALRDGLSELPSADASIRALLEDDARAPGVAGTACTAGPARSVDRGAARPERFPAHRARAGDHRSHGRAHVAPARTGPEAVVAARCRRPDACRSRRAAPAHRTALRRDAQARLCRRGGPGCGNAAT